MTDLAVLTVRLEAETSKYQAGLNASAKQLQEFQNKVKDALEDIRNQFIAVFTVDKITEFIESTVESAAALQKLSEQAGVGVAQLSALGLAAASAGISQDEMGTSLRKLNQSIAEAAGDPTSKAAYAFQALGISVTNSNGSLKTAGQLIPTIADAYARFANGPAKVAVNTDIFGRSMQSLIPVLNGGSAALADFQKQADEAGITLSDEVARAADEVEKKFSLLKQTFASGFGGEVLAAILPSLNAFADGLANIARQGDATSGPLAAFVKILQVIGSVVIEIDGEFRELGSSVTGVGDALQAVSEGQFQKAWDILNKQSEDAVAIRKATNDALLALSGDAGNQQVAIAQATAARLAAIKPPAPIEQPDFSGAFQNLTSVDLSKVGLSLGDGFKKADTAVAATSAAVGNLWKSADAYADSYFADVLAGSQTPIIDPKVIADQEASLDGLHGADLSKIGESLGAGFTAAKAPVVDTWKVAQAAADDYLAQIKVVSATPIVNSDSIKDQAAGISRLTDAWRTDSAASTAMWESADNASADYFARLDALSKTPILDPSVVAEQRKAFGDLQNNTHLGDVGKQLTNGLAESEKTLVLVSTQVDDLWKSAGDSADGFFDKLHNAGSIAPQLVTPQIQQQDQAQKKLEDFASGIQAQAASFGLGTAAATTFKLSFGPLADAIALARKNLSDLQAQTIDSNPALIKSAQATLAAVTNIQSAAQQLQGLQDVKTLKDFAQGIQQQVVAFDQGTVASVNYRLSTGQVGEAVDRANKTLAEVPASTSAANDSVRALASSLLSLVANAKSAAVALQTKQDTREIDNYTAKLNDQLLKYAQSDVAAVDFATTTGKLGEALARAGESGAIATAHIHDLAVELTLAKDKDALFNVDQEILTMTGHLVDASKAAFDFQNKIVIKNIAATGGSATQQQIDDLKKLGVSQDQYNAALEEAARLQTEEAAIEAATNKAVLSGQISVKAGQDAINAARQNESAQLDKLGPQIAAYGQQQLDNLAKLKDAEQAFQEQVNLTAQIRADEALKESEINEKIATGQVDTLDGQRQISESRAAELVQLADIQTKLQGIADASGLDSLKLQAKQAQAALNELAVQAVDPLAKKLKDDFANSASDAFASFVTGSQTASQAIHSFITSVESELVKLATNKILEQLFNTSSGSGFFSGLASLFGGGAAPAAGAASTFVAGSNGVPIDAFFASGGHADAGGSYMVGEKGPEMFVPDTGGTVVPNGKWGGTTIHLTQQFVLPPGSNVSRQTQQQIGAQAYSGTSRASRRNN